MTKSFNFEQVGKRMPYSTPDGFFEQMQNNILNTTKQSGTTMAPAKRKRSVMKMVLSFTLSAAAAVTLFFVVQNPNTTPQQSNDSWQQVDKAFTHLSTNDQDFLIEVYQEDFFINEQ